MFDCPKCGGPLDHVRSSVNTPSWYCLKCDGKPKTAFDVIAKKDAEIAALKARVEELEVREAFCEQHMRNIKTWMRPGFNSHCTDAMLIMAGQRDEAQGRVKELEADRTEIDAIARLATDDESWATRDAEGRNRAERALERITRVITPVFENDSAHRGHERGEA